MRTEKSFSLKQSDIKREWWHIDATDLVVGRLSSEVAKILRGKHKPTFTPNQECGDFVVITNASKIKFTGNKLTQKKYFWHTGYIGGIKEKRADKMLADTPERIIFEAVKGMLPKTTLGRKQLTKLKVFAGENHEHEAQQPKKLDLKI